ncbi:ricin-type beta-trefoil lectin domain protein [Bacterioplanoides sp.]|uniref:ricin-type beta-trefoil lectin domain protein n=1 Tax=Bacterioplanoides sp. TaxID=2066072 RepID=UPI003AFF68D7
MFLRLLLGSLLVLLSWGALAESYIYLTNNTNQALTLDIQQSGSPLVKGEHWRQLATRVPPYGTVAVLETNRDQGIRWGKSYYFDTTVTAPDGSTTVLQQKLTGTWNFSEIWYGANHSGLYEGRDLYSQRQDFAGKPSTLAFKGEAGRVSGDDFYYVIHPDPEYPQLGMSNELNVLAYNVWALLPGLVARDTSDRLTEISKQLNGFDVVVFSELFENNRREDFLQRIRGQYPYQTQVVDRRGAIEDGGVLIVSRWPIEHEAQMTFSDCDADDCLASKGVMYARINKGGQKYHVFGSHTQAWPAVENQITRAKQFAEIKAFIDQQSIPASEAVIIAGDLNVDKTNFPAEHQQMLNILNAAEVPQTRDSYPYTADGNVSAWTDGTPEFLDYVLTSNAHLQPGQAESDVRVPRSIAASVFTKYDLSDHFAIEASLSFNTPASDPYATLFRELKDGRSGKCLDFPGTSPTNGAMAVIYDCQDVDWQKWQYNAVTGLLRNKANPDYCLDNKGEHYAGGGVHLWQCVEGSVNQQWEFVGDSLRPRINSSISLDAYGRDNNSDVGLWSVHGGENQQWYWGR